MHITSAKATEMTFTFVTFDVDDIEFTISSASTLTIDSVSLKANSIKPSASSKLVVKNMGLPTYGDKTQNIYKSTGFTTIQLVNVNFADAATPIAIGLVSFATSEEGTPLTKTISDVTVTLDTQYTVLFGAALDEVIAFTYSTDTDAHDVEFQGTSTNKLTISGVKSDIVMQYTEDDVLSTKNAGISGITVKEEGVLLKLTEAETLSLTKVTFDGGEIIALAETLKLSECVINNNAESILNTLSTV